MNCQSRGGVLLHNGYLMNPLTPAFSAATPNPLYAPGVCQYRRHGVHLGEQARPTGRANQQIGSRTDSKNLKSKNW